MIRGGFKPLPYSPTLFNICTKRGLLNKLNGNALPYMHLQISWITTSLYLQVWLIVFCVITLDVPVFSFATSSKQSTLSSSLFFFIIQYLDNYLLKIIWNLYTRNHISICSNKIMFHPCNSTPTLMSIVLTLYLKSIWGNISKFFHVISTTL